MEAIGISGMLEEAKEHIKEARKLLTNVLTELSDTHQDDVLHALMLLNRARDIIVSLKTKLRPRKYVSLMPDGGYRGPGEDTLKHVALALTEPLIKAREPIENFTIAQAPHDGQGIAEEEAEEEEEEHEELICPLRALALSISGSTNYPACIGPRCAWWSKYGMCAIRALIDVEDEQIREQLERYETDGGERLPPKRECRTCYYFTPTDTDEIRGYCEKHGHEVKHSYDEYCDDYTPDPDRL